MKAYLCDKCQKVLEDGPVGEIVNVKVEIQPFYAPIRTEVVWHLCRQHGVDFDNYVLGFLRNLHAA